MSYLHQRITTAELRRRFNDGAYTARKIEVLTERPAPPRAGQPLQTMSQLIGYFEDGKLVAKAHQYLRPDGSIGASGKPDPKWLCQDGVIYSAAPPACREPKSGRGLTPSKYRDVA